MWITRIFSEETGTSCLRGGRGEGGGKGNKHEMMEETNNSNNNDSSSNNNNNKLLDDPIATNLKLNLPVSKMFGKKEKLAVPIPVEIFNYPTGLLNLYRRDNFSFKRAMEHVR